MAAFPFKVSIAPSVISQEVLLGETLLMDVKSLTYFGLDAFGSSVWRQFDECDEADEVYRRLKQSIDLEEEVLARKFMGLLKGLEMSGTITLEPISAG